MYSEKDIENTMCRCDYQRANTMILFNIMEILQKPEQPKTLIEKIRGKETCL